MLFRLILSKYSVFIRHNEKNINKIWFYKKKYITLHPAFLANHNKDYSVVKTFRVA